MVDRQDIDALLIGSLYGELSSTEEARLTAHLESHPADRTALANLTRARDVVRESRILQVQFEPPQSINALLIQEAARRAPKPRDGMSWFQRFMRSVLLHPAMAAAAMLVLIIGVAGTMYLKKGDHFARQTKEAPELAGDGVVATPPAAQPAQTATITVDGGAFANEQYQVGLQEGAGGKLGDKAGEVGNADQPARDENKLGGDRLRQLDALEKKQQEAQLSLRKRREADNNEEEKLAAAKEGAAPKKDSPSKPAKTAAPRTPEPVAKTAPKQERSKGYIEVTTPDQRPKDFDSKVAGRGDAAKQDSTVANTRPAGPATGSVAPTPAPPPPAAPPAESEAKPADPKPADPMLAWAKEQHGKAIAAAKKDCKLAASIAMQIANRAPSYYAASIENDRALKSCRQYIAAEREKEVERANRAKATQRRATDEAPAPKPAATSK